MSPPPCPPPAPPQIFTHGSPQSPKETPQQEAQEEPDYFDLQQYAKWMREEWVAPNWGAENRDVFLRIVHDLRRELLLAEEFKLVVVNAYLQQYWPKEQDSSVLWLFRYVEAVVRYNVTCTRALFQIEEKLEGRSSHAWEDLALCLTIGESVLHTAVKDINDTVGDHCPPDLDRDRDPMRLYVIVSGIERVADAITKVCTKVSDVCYQILKKECLED